MKSLYRILLIVFASVSLTACLDDDPITDYDAIKPVVLIPNGNWPSNAKANPLALDFKSEAQLLDVYARVSFESALSKDVTVTFQKDPAIITAYNAKFGTTYTELSADAFKLPTLTVVIPAGKTEAKISVELFADKIDLSKSNMIAFRLTDAAGENIASNFQQYVVPILVKNSFEGNYSVEGYFFHPSAPRGIKSTKYLSTIGSKRCEGQVGDLGGWGYQFDVEGTTVSNWSASGSTPASPSSGFMTLDNPAGIPTYPGPGTFAHTAYPNSYDPAAKTFKFHYGYAGGSSGEAGYTRQIYETWKRL